MEIKFFKDITKEGQDGLDFIYKVNEREIKIEFCRSLLTTKFKIVIHTKDELFKQIKIEALIEDIIRLCLNEHGLVKKIGLYTDGIRINGKLCYLIDVLVEFIKNNEK